MRDAALLLLGHGSTLNADSSAPTYQHAEEIRRRGIFAEVHVGFWKEEPNFRQALRQTSRRTVYVVPNFISSGYFTEQIIPRELGLSGPITRIGEQDVYYCQPVGLSPAMTEVLLKRAQEVVAASAEPCDPKSTCLFICGHGTSMNDNSTKIIHEQAAIIRARGIYADCQGVLMEQRPFVKDWRTLTTCPNVIVVPFFISDGLHSYEDIPVLLGLTHNMSEKGFTNPHREGKRRLCYGSAIGTEPSIADVIIDQVRQFEDANQVNGASAPAISKQSINEELARLQKDCSGDWLIGQVKVWDLRDGTFRIQHKGNDYYRSWCEPDSAPPREIGSLAELRRVISVTAEGAFRPLRADDNLQEDWFMIARDLAELHTILDYIYPAALANWTRQRKGHLLPTPWRETAERQSGRFHIVRGLDDTGVRQLAKEVCDRKCLKQRLWSPAVDVVQDANDVPLLCPEACNYFVSKAREKLKGPEAETE